MNENFTKLQTLLSKKQISLEANLFTMAPLLDEFL